MSAQKAQPTLDRREVVKAILDRRAMHWSSPDSARHPMTPAQLRTTRARSTCGVAWVVPQ